MDQKLRFDLINNVVGAEKIDSFRSKILEAASGTYLLEKGLEAANFVIEKGKSIVEYGDNLEALSQKIGISAQALSGFQAAADLSNLSSENLEKGLKKLVQQMGDPNAENFHRTLSALGISGKDAGTVIDQLADKFSKMEDGPKKASLAVRLFGKGGTDMIPFLNQGSEALKRYGIHFSEDFVSNADKFNDTMAISKNLIFEQAIALTEKYIPVLTDVVTAWNEVQIANREATDMGDSLDDIRAFAAATYYVFKLTVDQIDGLFTGIKNEWTFLKAINEEAANILTAGLVSPKKFGQAWKEADDEINERANNYQKRAKEREADVAKFEETLLKLSEQRKAGRKPTKAAGGGPEIDEESDKLRAQLEQVEKFKTAKLGQLQVERSQLENYELSASELERLTFAEKLKTEADKESIGWASKSKEGIKAATDEIIRQKYELIKLEEEQRQTFTVGARKGFTAYVEGLKDLRKQGEDFVTNGLNKMEDAFVELALTGKSTFRALADSIVADLTRIAVKQAELGLLDFFHLGGGRYIPVGGGTPIDGGIDAAPGISGPSVASVTAKAGTLPGLSSGGDGGVVIQSLVIQDSGVSAESGSQTGLSLANIIGVEVKKVIANEKRPGGTLYRG